jgi:hypothetical protein
MSRARNIRSQAAARGVALLLHLTQLWDDSGAAAAWPLEMYAQQGERTRRIGTLLSGREADPEMQSHIGVLRGPMERVDLLTRRNWRRLSSIALVEARHGSGCIFVRRPSRPLHGLPGGTRAEARRRQQAGPYLARSYRTNGHSPWSSGLQASSAGIVASCL